MAQLKTSRFLRSHESKGFGSLKLLKAMSCNLVSPIHKLRFCVAFVLCSIEFAITVLQRHETKSTSAIDINIAGTGTKFE